MMLLQPARRYSALVFPAFYAPDALGFAGAIFPLRSSMFLLQSHDPIRSAEADYLSDAAVALALSGGTADPVDVADEFVTMLAAIRAKAAADYSGTYRLDYVVQTVGARAALADMLKNYDPIYVVEAPDFMIYKGGVLQIEWRIEHAGIYQP